MDSPRPTPDDSVDRATSLGGDVRRWIREADDRLKSLGASTADVPRADDFGHLTPEPAPREAPCAEADVRSPSAPWRAGATDRTSAAGGIVVASGWGGRARA